MLTPSQHGRFICFAGNFYLLLLVDFTVICLFGLCSLLRFIDISKFSLACILVDWVMKFGLGNEVHNFALCFPLSRLIFCSCHMIFHNYVYLHWVFIFLEHETSFLRDCFREMIFTLSFFSLFFFDNTPFVFHSSTFGTAFHRWKVVWLGLDED